VNNQNLSPVDELGRVKAKMAELATREKALVDQLKACGPGTYNGALFDAVIFTQSRPTTNWKVIAVKLKISQRMIDANTTTTYGTVLTIKARSQAAA